METKAISIEVKDLDLEKGTAIIAHSVYDNIDLTDDIARKGMFTKSWNESKQADGSYDIYNYLNHEDSNAWAKTIGVTETDRKAYTHVKAGSHTFGQDVMKMLDEGIATRASFGYETKKANRITVKGKRVRELKEVVHLETSVLTKLAANPEAGLVAVRKSFNGLKMDIKALSDPEQRFVMGFINTYQTNLEAMVNFCGKLDPSSDLYTYINSWIAQLNSNMADMKYQIRWNTGDTYRIKSLPPIDSETKDAYEKIKKFIHNSDASDETLEGMERDIKAFEGQLLSLNTADTGLITQPAVSVEKNETKELADALLISLFKHF